MDNINLNEISYDELLSIYTIVKEYLEYLEGNIVSIDEGEEL
jgi:hypothetical protein